MFQHAKKFYGNKFYGNWTLVPVVMSSNLIHSRKFSRIPKLSPSKFFHFNVKFAIYIDSKLIFQRYDMSDLIKYTSKLLIKNDSIITQNAVLTVIR